MGECGKNGVFYAVRTDTMQLVWTKKIGTRTSNGVDACLSGGIWDGARLFVAGSGRATVSS